ncbi:asparagine synthase (glutamine-hydrolyzing) [Ranunculus cassubicifolius]
MSGCNWIEWGSRSKRTLRCGIRSVAMTQLATTTMGNILIATTLIKPDWTLSNHALIPSCNTPIFRTSTKRRRTKLRPLHKYRKGKDQHPCSQWTSSTRPLPVHRNAVQTLLMIIAVVKRLMTDVPFGVLLSGGLDSSLVAAVASRQMKEAKVANQWGSQLHTFCVGLKGSPDLKAAREVADYLGTRHHEFYFTVQEGLDALEEVIYHIETYDVTTIRASTPMFLMSRRIKSLGVKMVLSGEGSDEIFGGYLYFHKAPNKEELHQETCRKIKALHLYDCLRANKSTSAWGVEARVPFLDKEFINAMDIDPEWKMHILYRQKEQFSDGVGYSWIDGLKDHANEHVSDGMLANASFVYPENTPTTKEAYYYRTIFERFFPKNAARSTVPGGPSVACSTAKAIEWDASWSKNLDPSGRAALGVHADAYKEAGESVPVTNKGIELVSKSQDGVMEAAAIVV